MNNQIRKALVAVLLPREHLPFIREWCLHHLAQGWKVFIYDNTGSLGSARATSVFKLGHLQQQSVDKRGNSYGRFTSELTDEEVSQAMKTELEGLDVEVVPWQPRDGTGRILHGQVEAYVHFIRERGSDFRWAAFIDADEYLDTAEGLAWDSLLEELEGMGCCRLMLGGHVYESRWTADGRPRNLDDLACCGLQVARNKNIVRPDKTIMADIHWGWRMEGSNQYATIDPLQFYFRHYMGDQLRYGLKLNPPPPLQAEAESVMVRDGQPSLSRSRDISTGSCPQALLKWRISSELEKFIRSGLPKLLPSPRRILELGPGFSTLLLAEVFPGAHIISVEHDRNWLMRELAPLCGRGNVELVLAPADPETRWYSLRPELLPEFDLLLVDGPPGGLAPRVREKATILRGNLTPGAVVILNNTDRKDEAASISAWRAAGLEIEEESKGFAVLRLPRELSGIGSTTGP
jgi:hypothetical protein